MNCIKCMKCPCNSGSWYTLTSKALLNLNLMQTAEFYYCFSINNLEKTSMLTSKNKV